MSDAIRLSLTPDQVCALNNALRREIEIQRRLIGDTSQIGVQEYVKHLSSALEVVTKSWERAFGFTVEKIHK
ncbi:MAG: hypothetical protein E5V75_35040 [Mesorhizobium sp.]|nr:MAG: hypothetical protein E5V75_35040 [Mesorhizobium sp.]